MMIHFGWAITALFIGGTIGFFAAAMCSAAARNDTERETNN